MGIGHRSGRGEGVGRRMLAVWVLLPPLVLGCATRQFVPLVVHPPDARVYVDGSEAELSQGGLELRADRDHKLFFKRDGYRSELVVLRSEQGPALTPARVEVRLQSSRPTGRRIEVEAEAPLQ